MRIAVLAFVCLFPTLVTAPGLSGQAEMPFVNGSADNEVIASTAAALVARFWRERGDAARCITGAVWLVRLPAARAQDRATISAAGVGSSAGVLWQD